MPRRCVMPVLAALVVAAAFPVVGATQDSLPPWNGGLTSSLGQPARSTWFGGATAGVAWQAASDVQPVGLLTFGNRRSIGNPVVGLLGASVEAYAGFRGAEVDGGARALVSLLSLRFQGGVEYDMRDNHLYPVLAFNAPLRRGGIFGGGSLLRAEWSIGNAFRLSVLVPLAQPAAGRTRPRRDKVMVAQRRSTDVPGPDAAPGLAAALANIRCSAMRIQQLVVPGIDAPGADPEEALAPVIAQLRRAPSLPFVAPDSGLDVDAVVRFYHAELARAFSIAVSGQVLAAGAATPEGAQLAASARTALLDHALYPYNRLLGQWKAPGTLASFSAYARGHFARAVAENDVAPGRQAAVFYVFQELLTTIDSVEARETAEWKDNRVLWLPLQLGLLPEDHDAQGELDAIVEQAVGQPFTDGNRVWYVINEQFESEVTRSILDARQYHVLWIHDFSGRNDLGQPDAASLRYVVDSYLRALTEAVRRYDGLGRLPVYLIFLDEHYYEQNDGRVWLDILERPLDAKPDFPKGFEEFNARILGAQGALREAVAQSALLQSEARQYGQAWLRNVVKVQVNITNPADPSFWGPGILPVIGFPDNIMRDHRKIVFYDLSEDDPYSGLAIFTGLGIGEHYVGQTWEDRSIMLQGPAALPLKEDARRLLLSQGMPGDRIPYPLRPRPMGLRYEEMVQAEIDGQLAAGSRDQRAMELHNLTGYQAKPINVAKATLYSLMPPGSVVKVPDSLWGSSIYAALLVGSAFRGVRVLFITPSLASAPSSGWPQMGITHDLFARLIVLQQQLGPELEASGGMLKTGIYNPGIGVSDVGARFSAAYRNGRRTPFLRRLFPIDAAVDTLLAHVGAAGLQPLPLSPLSPVTEQLAPKLHMKANFFATREGWDSLVSRPEMAPVLDAYVRQLARDPAAKDVSVRESAQLLSQTSQRLVEAFAADLTPEARARVAYFLIVGSANQDYRSMFMDGEASVLLSGWSGVVGLIDFGLIVNLSVWVDDLTLLDELLPPPSGFQRAVARQVRPAL